MKKMNPNDPKSLKDLTAPIKKELVITVLFSFFGALSLLITPVAATIAVNRIIHGDTKSFFLWVIIGGIGLALRQILHYASLGYAHIVEAKFRYRLRKDFSDKLSRLPLGFFSETSSGAIRKFISEDTIKIHTIVAHGFSEIPASVTLPLGCAVIMVLFEWHTALILLGIIFAIILVGMVWMNLKNRQMGDINSRYEKAQREVSHGAIEMVDGIKEIKNFGLSGSLFQRFDENVKEFSRASFAWLNASAKALAFIMSIIQPTVMLFIALGVCLFSLKNGWLLPEQTILFILLAMILPSSLISLLQIGNHIREGQHSVDTLLALYEKKDHPFSTNPRPFVPGDIEFHQVSFAYDEKNNVLENITCTLPQGKITALVGPSGSGKTTMARLIARFWDVREGSVTIGGVNVKDLSEQSLLSHISLVFQDVSLMDASISENIALARPNATKEEIMEAAKGAKIHERIMALPKGYDSVYGEENVVLSGGEKQRITIARAFLADTPIVLLDEATAQTDAQSEMEIQQALSLLSQKKTVVMIAHRLNSIVQAHQILVMDRGQIKEKGTHQELLEQNGLYKELWDAQNNGKGASA